MKYDFNPIHVMKKMLVNEFLETQEPNNELLEDAANTISRLYIALIAILKAQHRLLQINDINNYVEKTCNEIAVAREARRQKDTKKQREQSKRNHKEMISELKERIRQAKHNLYKYEKECINDKESGDK